MAWKSQPVVDLSAENWQLAENALDTAESSSSHDSDVARKTAATLAQVGIGRAILAVADEIRKTQTDGR